jgi:predicted nucleic acid-binding protein
VVLVAAKAAAEIAERLRFPTVVAEIVAAEIVAGVGTAARIAPDPDAEVHFDDDSSPWYSRCEVRSRDRRGLLHAIAVGIGAAGAEVHAARVTTDNGQTVDRFELTDGEGRNLDDAAKEAIRRALADGCRAESDATTEAGRYRFSSGR